jgi:hypothetical protein
VLLLKLHVFIVLVHEDGSIGVGLELQFEFLALATHPPVEVYTVAGVLTLTNHR